MSEQARGGPHELEDKCPKDGGDSSALAWRCHVI